MINVYLKDGENSIIEIDNGVTAEVTGAGSTMMLEIRNGADKIVAQFKLDDVYGWSDESTEDF